MPEKGVTVVNVGLFFIYLKGRATERKIFQLLVHFSNAYNGRCWASPQPKHSPGLGWVAGAQALEGSISRKLDRKPEHPTGLEPAL